MSVDLLTRPRLCVIMFYFIFPFQTIHAAQPLNAFKGGQKVVARIFHIHFFSREGLFLS